jgi:hypothetical protein
VLVSECLYLLVGLCVAVSESLLSGGVVADDEVGWIFILCGFGAKLRSKIFQTT